MDAFAQSSSAVKDLSKINSMRITPWYGNSHACELLTGLWQGKVYDTSGLFGNKSGGWPVTVDLVNKDGKFYGLIKATNQRRQSPLKGRVWADCKQGVLANTVLNAPQQNCGDYAPPSVLVTPKLLLLYVHMENAMIGTNFLLVLNPTHHKLTAGQVKTLTAKPAPTYQTCH